MKNQREVLIIEDSPTQAEQIRLLLHDRQVNSVWASGGRAGMELACQRQPGLILLDLEMPDLDGAQTLRLLKENARTAEIPVIILTARAESFTEKLGGMESLTIGYVPKDAFFSGVLLGILRQMGFLS